MLKEDGNMKTQDDDQTSIDAIKIDQHPWRKCPLGKHLVREHIVRVPNSKIHPNGINATWHEHCAMNSSHKDELSYAEIQHIAETYFHDLTTGGPTANVLTEFSDADKYDKQICG